MLIPCPPALQRNPGLAVQPVPFDRHHATERQRTDHAGALELETALLDDTARRDVGDPATGIDLVDFTRAKGHVDQRMRRFGHVSPVPVGFPQPVTDLQRLFVFLGFERAAAQKLAIVHAGNRIDALANLASFGASHKIRGVFGRVGVRHTRYHGRDIGIVGKMGKGVDVFFVRLAQNQPLRQ